MKTLRQYILRKSQQHPTPEEAQEMREHMRGRTADSAEDNPTAEHGQRYAVFQECPNCGHQLHGVHRVRANGSVDPRAVHYNDDANEAEREADDRTVRAAYKSHAKPAGYVRETEQINERRETPQAKRKHKFQPATWTHSNGHPRCRLCGDEEPVSGMCEGHKETYKSMSKGCPCCGTNRDECTCTKNCKHCTCHRKGLREYVDRDHDNA